MDWGATALVTAVYVALGAALLLALWPTERTGERFLLRWGMAEPTREQSLVAARYLRVRRILCVALLVVAPSAVAAAFDLDDSERGAFNFFTPLIVALLVAEGAAALRHVRGVRVAVLARRSWRDLVPAWALALFLALATLALGLALSDLAAPKNRLIAVAAGLCLAGVLGLVRLTVRRRTVADPDLDAVLRTRTARVVVGIGIGWLGQLAILAANRAEFLGSVPQVVSPALILVAAAGWIWVAVPSSRADRTQPLP